MKKIICLLIALSSFLISINAQWKEMDDFHTVMSETFHPSEEGKLGPIKSRSQEMVDKAVAWKKSTIPDGYDKKAVKASLKTLVKGSKELNKLVKDNASDKVLTEKLSALHDVFHEVMDKRKGKH
jgi:hypothetical protein